MIRASRRRIAAGDCGPRGARRPSRSSTARSRSATARSRSRAARCVIRNGRIVAAGGMRFELPAGTQVIDATGKWVTPGNCRRLLAARPGRGRSLPQAMRTARPTRGHADDTTAAVQRGDRRRSRAQPARHDDRGQPRRRSDARARRAVGRPKHLRRAGRGDRHRRRHGPGDRAAEIPVRRARPDRRRKSRRLARIRATSCSAMPCARPPSSAVMQARSRRRGAGAPSELDRPIVRNPNESRVYGPDARRSEDVLLTRFDAAALVPVLQGRQYLLVHVERASDILQVLALKRDFPCSGLSWSGQRRAGSSPTGSPAPACR